MHDLNSLPDHEAQLAYLAELLTDMETSQSDITDPRIYNVRYAKKNSDPDSPTFNQAMSGAEADKYIEAMKEEELRFFRV